MTMAVVSAVVVETNDCDGLGFEMFWMVERGSTLGDARWKLFGMEDSGEMQLVEQTT